MEKKFHLEMNCETGEQIEREYTPEEYAQDEADALAYAQQQATQLAEADALAALKASARAKLIAGEPLTEEEAATLVV